MTVATSTRWRRVYTLEELIAVPTQEGEKGRVPAGREIELPEPDAQRLARLGAVKMLDEGDRG